MEEFVIRLTDKEKKAAQKVEEALSGLRFSEVWHVLSYFVAWLNDPAFGRDTQAE